MKIRKAASSVARRLVAREYRAVVLVACIGVSLSISALWLIRDQLQAHKALEFEWVSHNRIRALSNGIENGLLAVTNLRDFFAATGSRDDDEFHLFAASQLRTHKALHALIWIPVVTPTNGVGNTATADIAQGYFLSGRQGTEDPVKRFDPAAASGLPAGLGSAASLHALLEHARSRGRMAASGRIEFKDVARRASYGFMAALPVYTKRKGVQPELRGFTLGLFRLDEVISASIALLEPRGVDILLLDDSAEESNRFLHFYQSRLTQESIDDAEILDWERRGGGGLRQKVAVADRNWLIICHQTDHFRSAEAFSETPWVALLTGLLFTMLLVFYLDRQRKHARQRLKMEQQLIEREELFRQMTETVDEAFWAADVDKRDLLYLSPAFARITGAKSKARPSGMLEAVHQADKPLVVEALERIPADKTDVEVIYRIEHADGATRWLRTRGFPVMGEDDKVVRIVGFSEDITERKLADEALRKSESNLRDLFQQSPDVIMTVDARGKILLMNRSIPALPAERAVGHNSLALMPRDFRKWYRRALGEVFRQGVTRSFQNTTDDGVYWEGRIVPILSDGGVTAAMVIASDVSEKRSLEQQTLRNARLASIGVLAAGVAHEINNPNNAIQFNASIVSRVWSDVTPILTEYFEEQGDFALGGLPFSEAKDVLPQLLSDIHGNSERIRRIVENLKHMARQDAGEYSQRVDIRQVLETSLMILHNQVQKHTDSCTVDIPDVLPEIRGNGQQLEQVFINLLLNALQSLPDRSRGVQISVRHDPDKQIVEIVVADEGCGVSEHDLGRLTEPFFTTRTATGGTGLGLSISRSIMEKHGGSLSFESRINEGTRATIRLPYVGQLKE
ncbi:MAG: PAS domain S-box protein [Gammaproteobacteria bacterium]|nr:PAS domain S-box protein [Gammaproteobacteria bacterium]